MFWFLLVYISNVQISLLCENINVRGGGAFLEIGSSSPKVSPCLSDVSTISNDLVDSGSASDDADDIIPMSPKCPSPRDPPMNSPVFHQKRQMSVNTKERIGAIVIPHTRTKRKKSQPKSQIFHTQRKKSNEDISKNLPIRQEASPSGISKILRKAHSSLTLNNSSMVMSDKSSIARISMTNGTADPSQSYVTQQIFSGKIISGKNTNFMDSLAEGSPATETPKSVPSNVIADVKETARDFSSGRKRMGRISISQKISTAKGAILTKIASFEKISKIASFGVSISDKNMQVASTKGNTELHSSLLTHIYKQPQQQQQQQQQSMAIAEEILGGFVTPSEVRENVEKWVRKKVNPNAINQKGLTALHLSAARGNDVLFPVLVEHGGNANEKDQDGWTPLHYAAFFNQCTMIKLLVEKGTDPIAQDVNGKTALHIAAEEGCEDVINLLVDNGVYVNIEDKNGRTALQIAGQKGKDKVVDILLDGTVGNKLLSKLEEVTAASHETRHAITKITTLVGSIPLVASYLMVCLLKFSVLDPYVVGHSGYYMTVISWAGYLTFLGVMPNDGFLIRTVALCSMLGAFLSCLAFAGSAAYTYLEEPEVQTHDHGDHLTIYICNDLDHPGMTTGCDLWVGWNVCLSFIFLLTSLSILPNISRFEGSQFWDSTKKKGSRFNDGAFKLPARLALDRVWLSGRVCFCACGMVYIICSVLLYKIREEALFYSHERYVADLTAGISLMLSSVVFTHYHRQCIMTFFHAVIANDEADDAATVAAMMGDANARESLKLAKDKFRSINFDDLASTDFHKNVEAPGKKNELYKKTKPAMLGRCDAFISHSWSDDGAKKYRALQRWAKEFKTKNGHSPDFWLDKACIDQRDIASNLQCLPVFTAGCKTLLILAGSTYTERLWCIVEVFVFLKMGGAIDRITVLPINMTEETAKKMFEEVDSETALCYKQEDKQKLLGIIEQGFGNLEEFDEILRHVFNRQMVSRHMTHRQLGFAQFLVHNQMLNRRSDRNDWQRSSDKGIKKNGLKVRRKKSGVKIAKESGHSVGKAIRNLNSRRKSIGDGIANSTRRRSSARHASLFFSKHMKSGKQKSERQKSQKQGSSRNSHRQGEQEFNFPADTQISPEKNPEAPQRNKAQSTDKKTQELDEVKTPDSN